MLSLFFFSFLFFETALPFFNSPFFLSFSDVYEKRGQNDFDDDEEENEVLKLFFF